MPISDDSPAEANASPKGGAVNGPRAAGGARGLLVLLAVSAVFFFSLWLMGFPVPMADDLFDTGPSLNLVNGGDLSNPLLERQLFPGHYFFMYPPVHPYAVAGWLKLVGISAGTMTGFQVLMYFITCTATIFFLRRQGAPAWLQWIVPLAVASTFLPLGLRPEPMAVALSMTGLAVVECCGRGKLSLLLGFFLMALGAGTTPRLALFSGALILATGYKCWRDTGGSAPKLRSLILLAVTGMAAAFLVFLVLIDFRFLEFWKVFSYHSSQITGLPRLKLLGWFFTRWVYVTQWPVFPILLGLLAICWRGSWNHLQRIGFTLAGAFVAVFIIRGLGDGTIWFVYLTVLVLAAAWLQSDGARFKKLFAVGLTATLMFANFRPALALIGIATGKITLAKSANYQQAQAIRASPGHTVLLDETAARYVFNYHIPPGFIYYPFSMVFPNSQAIVADSLRPGDTCILGPMWVEGLNQRHFTDFPIPTWSFFLPRWSYFCQPREVHIIPVETLHRDQK